MYFNEFDFENDFFYENENVSLDQMIEYNMQNQYQSQSFFKDPLENNQPLEEKIQKNHLTIPLNEVNDDINFKGVQEFQTKEDPYVQNLKESKNLKENSANRSTCCNSGQQERIAIKKQKFQIDKNSEKYPPK